MRSRSTFVLGVVFFAALLSTPQRAEAADARACADAFDKGQALRHDGKLTSARAQLLICSDQSCPSMVVKDCSDLLTEVEQSTPSIVIAAKDASGHDAINVKVTSDGAVIASSLTGTAIAIDPGVHAMRFEMPGATPLDRQIVVHEGQKAQTIEVTLDANPPPAVSVTPITQQPATDTTSPTTGETSPVRYAAYGAAGVGIVAIGIGSAFGLIASSKWSDAQSQCSNGCGNGSQAYDSRSTARSDATISTVGFVAGGVLIAGGAALYFFGPKEKAKVAVTASPYGVLMRGQF